MDYLDDLITRSGAAAYCLYASSDEPDMRYLTRFVTHDPVPVIKIPGEEPIMIVPIMEADRAERESSARVITRQQAGYQEIIRHVRDPTRITAAMIHQIAHGAVVVPPRFPLGLARALERENPVILDESGTVARMRSVKRPEEISHIRRAQLAVEMAMKEAITQIQKSEVREGILWYNDTPLTSELVRFTIQTTLLSQGYSARDTIVACGEDTAQPHCVGSGPLQSAQPIVIDIFPQCQETGYHADMTRTVSKGTPSSAVCELYDAVSEAQDLGESMVSAGVSGADCHQKVRDYFEERGFRSDTEGFTHSLGHGNISTMECPVCGTDHIHEAGYLLSKRQNFFSPCPQCRRVLRDKSLPPDDSPASGCDCGKVFIDDVYVQVYHLLQDAGVITGKEPLFSVGTPLIDPGTFLS